MSLLELDSVVVLIKVAFEGWQIPRSRKIESDRPTSYELSLLGNRHFLLLLLKVEHLVEVGLDATSNPLNGRLLSDDIGGFRSQCFY